MKKKSILICDDEAGLRESYKLILQENYDLTFAASGEELLNKLKSFSPDLLILDIKMPKINGLDLLKQIRKFKPNIKVIIATGYQSVETAAEASRLGVLDYITKPFESKHLVEVVKKSLL